MDTIVNTWTYLATLNGLLPDWFYGGMCAPLGAFIIITCMALASLDRFVERVS